MLLGLIAMLGSLLGVVLVFFRFVFVLLTTTSTMEMPGTTVNAGFPPGL